MTGHFAVSVYWLVIGLIGLVFKIAETRHARRIEYARRLRRWNEDRQLRLYRWNTSGPWGQIHRSYDRGRHGGCEGEPL